MEFLERSVSSERGGEGLHRCSGSLSLIPLEKLYLQQHKRERHSQQLVLKILTKISFYCTYLLLRHEKKKKNRATFTLSLFLKEAAAVLHLCCSCPLVHRNSWFSSSVVTLTLVLQGASYLTVPASQTLGREPAFHLSFTLLPQIMDLETTVNMQPQ